MIRKWITMIALNCIGFPNYGITMEGDVYNLDNGKRLNGTIDKGYVRVKLYRNGEYKRFYAHDLMAKAFMNPDYSPFVVNHINGNKRDNRLNNLEIISQSNNIRHANRVLGKKKTTMKGRMVYMVYAPFEKETFRIFAKKADAMQDIFDDKDKTMYPIRIE